MLPGRCDIQPAEAEVGVDSPAELLLVDEELAHDCARVPPLQRPHVPDDSGTLQDVWRGGGPVLPGQGALQLGTNIHDRYRITPINLFNVKCDVIVGLCDEPGLWAVYVDPEESEQ